MQPLHVGGRLPLLTRSVEKLASRIGCLSSEETLLQIAGHLRGRALEEWNLMDCSEKENLQKATDTLKKRLDPGSNMLAAQDFRRAAQQENELIVDYISRHSA